MVVTERVDEPVSAARTMGLPRGQQIGRLGSSGNSFGPHLHFALLNAPEYFQADSIPFVIDRFTLEGTGAVSDADVVVTGPAREVRRVHPLVFSVSDFR